MVFYFVQWQENNFLQTLLVIAGTTSLTSKTKEKKAQGCLAFPIFFFSESCVPLSSGSTFSLGFSFPQAWKMFLHPLWAIWLCSHLLFFPSLAYFLCFFRSFLFVHANLLTIFLAFLHVGIDCTWVWRSWFLKKNPALLKFPYLQEHIP